MNRNSWWYYTEVLDRETCNRIISLANNWCQASTGGEKPEFALKNKIRDSKIFWTNEQWLYDLVWPFMVNANEKAGWKYDITKAEDCQITKYEEKNYFNFHLDGDGDHFAAQSEKEGCPDKGLVRKLSMTILLNDDYEGGNFEFALYKDEECKKIIPDFNKSGSIVVFPSFVEHRVKPITKGERHSLVCWFVGPPFK